MKILRLLLLFILVSGVGLSAWGQTHLSEDFSTASGSTPPAGWTNNDISGSGNVWEFNNPGTITINSPLSSPAAGFDSDNYGGGTENCALESPVVDLSSSSGTILLEFDHYFRSGYGGAYAVEVYDGTSWVSVLSSTSSTINPASASIDVTTHLGGISNAQVRFRWTGDYSWYWFVDNVVLKEVSCISPTTLIASSVTATSASLGWTANSSESNWEIAIQALGAGIPASVYGTGTATSSNPYSATGLTAATDYEFYVRADCNGDGSDLSDWVGPFAFTTTVLCPAPSGMGITGTTATTGGVSWTAGGSETTWDLEWKAGANFTPGTGAEDDAATHSGSPAYTMTGLIPATTYYVHYRANCGGGNGESVWVYAGTLTTECAVETPDYTEDFTTFLNPCWEEATGPISGPTAFGSSGWTNDNFGNTGSNNSARINIYTTGNDEWLISPVFDLTGGGFEINLDVALTPWTGTASSTIEADDAVYAMQSIDGGTTWTTIYTWDNANSPSNTGDNLTIDISGVTSATTQFAIFSLEGATSGGDYRFFIDNFKVRTPPSCFAPTALGASSITATSASLNWTANSGETDWEIVIQAQGTGTPAGSGTAISANPHAAMSLTAQTDYEYYVRANCGANGYSAWTGPYNFTTPCTAETAPYTQDFDGTTAPALDACWNTINSTGSSFVYARTSTSRANSASNSLQLYNDFYTSGNLIAVSPMFSDFDAAKRIKFYVYDDNNGANLVIGTMSDPTDAATFTAFQTITAADMDNDAWEQFTVEFTGYLGTDKYIAFKHDMASSYDYLYIDDFEYEEILANDAAVTTVTPPNSGCGLTAAESVDVVITNNGTATIAVGAASVSITGAGNSPAAVTNTGTIAAGATETITITGVDLSAVQAYTLTATVTLAGDGNAANDAGTGDVTNITTISSFPYNEDFESGAGDWTTSGTNSSWAVGTPSGPVITAAATGSNAFVTNLSGDYNASELSYLTSPCFDLTGAAGYELSFNLARDFENCCDEAWVEYTTDGTTWVKLGTASSGGTNWYNDSGNDWWDNDVTAWTLTSHDISALSGNSSVRFRFVMSSDGGVQDDGVGIDDISITEVSCPDPTTLTVSSLTSTSASLDWTEVGTATAWDIEWGAAGFSTTGTPTITGTATKPYGLTSLAANTSYDFYVRSNCGGSTSDWVGPYTFTTPCVAVATFYEDFESSTSSTLPDCMQKSGSTQTVVVNTTPSNAYAGDNSLRLYGTNATFVLPITSNIDAGTHRLRMQVRATSSSNVRVGYIIDPDDASTFTELQTLSITTSYQEYVVVPGVTPPSGSYLALQHTGFSSMYFDDVYWEALPVTPPNCSVITSPADAATNQNVTTNLSWAANIDATGYKLSIGTTTGGTDILNASDLGNVTSYDPPADLAFNTTYYVTLIAYNVNGDATSCSETTFTTKDGCAIPSSPTNGSTTASATPTISWSSVTGATGYMVSIGTTAGGTDILNAHDNGSSTSYAASGLSYITQYYVSVKAYNANGTTSAACNTYEFTTQANPNYGGGPDGTDPNQMTSGGYYFANSLAGAGASMTQPTYSWIDPVAAGHTEITSWTSGSDDDGNFTIPDIGFDFTFYGTTYRTSNAFVSSNGLLAFGTGYSGGTASFTIPSTSGPEAFIAGCYADLDDGANGKIYYGGDATQFVITWLEVIDYNDQTETISFQIILYPNGLVKIQYNDVLSTADELGNPNVSTTLYGDALIGIENAAGDKGISYRDNGSGGPMFGSPMALAFNTNENALPVELTKFTAQAEGTTNVLAWETASEENNAYFDVERSANGVDFETIGQVEGNGTTVEVSNYNFIDENPLTVSYYRLRQVDFDGQFAYSDVRIVKREKATNNTATFYPVPVTDRLTIDFEATQTEDLNITVVDALGRQVITKVVRTVEGENQFTVDFDALPIGTYFIKLQSNNANVIRTIIKK